EDHHLAALQACLQARIVAHAVVIPPRCRAEAQPTKQDDSRRSGENPHRAETQSSLRPREHAQTSPPSCQGLALSSTNLPRNARGGAEVTPHLRVLSVINSWMPGPRPGMTSGVRAGSEARHREA